MNLQGSFRFNITNYLCTYVLMYLCTYVLMYLCTYVLMYLCTYVLMYLCTYVLMSEGVISEILLIKAKIPFKK
jgi:hypothetical protein